MEECAQKEFDRADIVRDVRLALTGHLKSWYGTYPVTRLPFAVSDQRVVLNILLILCSPASLETYQREHPELALLRPVGLTARPGRPRAEEILLVHRHALRSDAVSSPPPENSAAHGRPP